MSDEALFTLEEVQQHDGERRRRKLIAYRGVVYDVSACPKWQLSQHEGLHWAGQDLTDALADAPHNVEVFSRPCVKRAGRLV